MPCLLLAQEPGSFKCHCLHHLPESAFGPKTVHDQRMPVDYNGARTVAPI